MIRNIALTSARKGGPGSGFSDPRCRRGIPGQRGGSINICEPGGLAKAVGMGVDVSDVDIRMKDVLADIPTKREKLDYDIEATKRAVRERIDEPNKVTRREILEQQLKLPFSTHKANQEYFNWHVGPRAAESLWLASGRLDGMTSAQMRNMSYRAPKRLGAGDIDIDAFAQTLAMDRELSQQTWGNNDRAWRGIKVRNDLGPEVNMLRNFVRDHQGEDINLLFPNNYLESWTEDFDEAADFASAGGHGGLVLERLMPREDILLSHRAIPGLETEKELIRRNLSSFTPYNIRDVTVVN